MDTTPSLGRFIVDMGESKNISKELLQEFIDEVKKGALQLNINTIFQLDEVSDAHQLIEENKARGKVGVKIKACHDNLQKQYSLGQYSNTKLAT